VVGKKVFIGALVLTGIGMGLLLLSLAPTAHGQSEARPAATTTAHAFSVDVETQPASLSEDAAISGDSKDPAEGDPAGFREGPILPPGIPATTTGDWVQWQDRKFTPSAEYLEARAQFDSEYPPSKEPTPPGSVTVEEAAQRALRKRELLKHNPETVILKIPSL